MGLYNICDMGLDMIGLLVMCICGARCIVHGWERRLRRTAVSYYDTDLVILSIKLEYCDAGIKCVNGPFLNVDRVRISLL